MKFELKRTPELYEDEWHYSSVKVGDSIVEIDSPSKKECENVTAQIMALPDLIEALMDLRKTVNKLPGIKDRDLLLELANKMQKTDQALKKSESL